MLSRKDKKAAQRTEQLTTTLKQLANAQGAYRPGPPVERQNLPFSVRLDLFGDVANYLGLTSGDFLVTAVELLESIDRHKDFAKAQEDVSRRVFLEGSIRNVYDIPLKRLVRDGQSLGSLITLIAFVFRAEAWFKTTVEEQGKEQAQQLLEVDFPEELRSVGADKLL